MRENCSTTRKTCTSTVIYCRRRTRPRTRDEHWMRFQNKFLRGVSSRRWWPLCRSLLIVTVELDVG